MFFLTLGLNTQNVHTKGHTNAKAKQEQKKDSQTNKVASVKLGGEFDPLTATNTQSSDLILSLNTQEISKFRLFFILANYQTPA